MKLNLRRPIVFFDLETTGTNISRDRIVEISIVKVMPDGTEIVKTRRVNPEMPIPAEATAIHHITDDDVRNEPTFRQIAKSLAQLFIGCDIAGFNSNRFDIPLLDQEFQRADVDFDFSKARFIDVRPYSIKRNRALSSLPIVSIVEKNSKTPTAPVPTQWQPTKCSKLNSSVTKIFRPMSMLSLNLPHSQEMSILSAVLSMTTRSAKSSTSENIKDVLQKKFLEPIRAIMHG